MISEVNEINKQKFLTELGKLLTFMYEEDRQRALAMYSAIFDETGDDNGVLQLLVSPTRQAVNLARAYDAKERKLQVTAQSRGDSGEAEPAFIHVIEQVREQASTLGIVVNEVPADQFSLFEDAALDTNIFDPQTLADELPEQADGDTAAELPEAPERYPDAEETEPAEPESEAAPEAPAEAEAEGGEEPAEPADDAEPENDVEAFADAVDAFLADFALNDAPVPAEEEPLPDIEVEIEQTPASEEPVEEAEAVFDALESQTSTVPDVAAAWAELDKIAPRTVRKPRVALLILFILLAVPLTLLGIGILLIPAALSLALAVLAVYTGVFGLGAAFGSFSVFADILLTLGCSIVLLALGLLLAWLFIWLLGGAIGGLIRGVCALGRKWCYKEEAAK